MQTNTDKLIATKENGIGWITFNNPARHNAVSLEMWQALTSTLEAYATDPDVRVIILKGAGEKAFVAGADISELATLTPIEARERARQGQALMRKVETLGKPVIARIQGYALGGGMELAMACHIRVAGEKAKIGQPEINLGLIPGFGGTQRLLRLAGRSATLELCLLGHQIDAQRAFALGVLNRVVAADTLDEEVAAIADQLAASAPIALAGILDAVLTGGECALDQGLDYEAQTFATCFATEDMREGTKAFLERRKASFSGR